MSLKIVEGLAVTAEIFGQEFSAAALKIMVSDLAKFPEDSVLQALAQVRVECNRLTLAEIVKRVDDGRPSVEQAWGMIPRSEECSVVWTEEMAEAYGACASLIAARDWVGARMAFKEVYQVAVNRRRAAQVPVKWVASLGHDPKEREVVLKDAVERGLLLPDQARGYLPALSFEAKPQALALVGAVQSIVEKEPEAERAKPEVAKRFLHEAKVAAGFKPLRVVKNLRSESENRALVEQILAEASV